MPTIEVIIPSLRQKPVERLAKSLALQSRPPDIITIVSNEVQPFEWPYSIWTRLLRFSSDSYSIGELDVALRQNVGIYLCACDFLVIQGDDQVAPFTMIADTLEQFTPQVNYIWGNHHLIDFDGKTMEEIRESENWVSREDPLPPFRHGYQSSYGGMFAARARFLQDFGAFDMAFNGSHGGEDQQLGHRLMLANKTQGSWICDPPYSWHPIELKQGDTRSRQPWLQPIRNGCPPGEHDLTEAKIMGMPFLACRRCNLRQSRGGLTLVTEPVIRFDPHLAKHHSIWLNQDRSKFP